MSALPSGRLARCGLRLNYASTAVTIEQRADGTAGFGGLALCGSVWGCPVCSARIRQGRAVELEEACARWLREGHGLTFVTLTLRHTRADALDGLLGVLSDAWAALSRHREWKEGAGFFGFVGAVRAVEVVHGKNGWHPHAHLLLFTERPLTRRRTKGLGRLLYRCWEREVTRLGATCESAGFNCQEVRGSRDVARYVSKVQDENGNERALGMEMTRADLKRRGAGVHPFTLLDDAKVNDSSRLLWREYERATHGRRCLTLGHQLGRRIGLRVEDPDPQERGTVAYTFDRDAWRLVIHAKARSRVLDAFEAGGVDAVFLLLCDLHAAYDWTNADAQWRAERWERNQERYANAAREWAGAPLVAL
ncbi:protein rep [Humibacter sp.]|uniref:protein rep n=1 Tax=Humibacter sp. TaxID=1940291 RepID=UPI002CC3962B|nr:protein rep [Humibacter sp.]HVX09211.1 protein rep [Humibacter sp.]